MKAPVKSPAALLAPGRALTFANVAEGAEGLVVSDLARAVAARPKPPAVSLAVVCRDGPRMQQLARALEFFAPDLPVMQFPAWDCQPYDRVSPHGGILAQRLTTLARLSRLTGSDKPLIVLTTVNAIVQRVPAREMVAAQALSVAPGHVVPMDSIVAWLEHNGYNRSSTVREPGEYAVRGGILDLFPAGLDQPVRFDFFGDSLESIRTFDAETQRTLLDMRALDLVPVSEFQLVTETIRRFRMGYVATFGAPQRDDLLYEAVSEGRRHPGMEHWLPLFQERMDTLFDYLDGAPVAIEPQGEDAARERFKQIQDYYEARREALEHPGGGAIYKPLPPDRLYLTETEWTERLGEAAVARLTPFAVPEGSADVFDAGARQGRNFTPERADTSVNVFEAVVAHVLALAGAAQEGGHHAVERRLARPHGRACCSDHKLANLTSVNTWRTVQATPRNEAMLAVVGMESGFETDEFAVISEQDILGDRLVRPRKSSRKLDNFISEVTSLATGDLVVHVEHGIGRFVGLQTIEVGGAPHDCLELHYAAETKLFLPVENIELLSRYGSDHANVELDRLGGGGWQARKAKLKNRIREIAGELIKIAAERHLHEAPKMPVQPHVYDEFCARFPYEETEDQLGGHQRYAEGSRKRPADGPADLRRCRLRQDRGGAARGICGRARRQAGRRRGADHAAGAAAQQEFRRTFSWFSGQCRAGLAPDPGQGTDAGQEGPCRRPCRHRRRHPCAARQVDQVQGSRASDRRRGTAFRRQPQGAAEAIAGAGACADAERDADPAHAATGADRRARSLDHRLAAGRSPRGAHLRGAARSADDPRGAAARTLPRRAGILRGAADRGSRRASRISSTRTCRR